MADFASFWQFGRNIPVFAKIPSISIVVLVPLDKIAKKNLAILTGSSKTTIQIEDILAKIGIFRP